MNLSLETLPFNWFDILLVVVLLVGLSRGRKRGISEELFPLLMWLAIVFGCAMLYQPLGTQITASTVFTLLGSYLMAYIGAALIIAILFAALKKAAGGKLVSSDVFGRSEFYLGMVAGVVRFVCMLIACLALLNARLYTSGDVRAQVKYQKDNYGSEFFPTLQTIQSQVFEKSLLGPWIKNNLSFLLITPTMPGGKDTAKRKDFAMP